MLCHKHNYSSAEKRSYSLYSCSVDCFYINSVFVHVVQASISPSMHDEHDKKERTAIPLNKFHHF